VAVDDVTLDSVAGLEKEMDQFYVDLLRFERDATTHDLVYRAENFRLRFLVHETPRSREDMRSTGILVPSFPALIDRLNELEIEFIRQKGLAPGEESLLLRDPAGNWLELFEMKLVA
jgi:catechol-2,3-dioxygenase